MEAKDSIIEQQHTAITSLKKMVDQSLVQYSHQVALLNLLLLA